MNIYEIVDRLLDLRARTDLEDDEKELLSRASEMLSEIEKYYCLTLDNELEKIIYPLDYA